MHRIKKRQTGFALLLVLLLLVAASTIALSYSLSSAMKTAGSGNLGRSARAKYLAESGLQHALYVLASDPSLLIGSVNATLGPFSVDNSCDTYSFYAVQDATVSNKYYLKGIGSTGNITRTCSYTVHAQNDGTVKFPYGMFIGGAGVSLPQSLTITGDVHSNGITFLNSAIISGDVTSVGDVSDPYNRITGDVSTGLDTIAMPSLHPNRYKNYTIDGVSYSAVTKTCKGFGAGDSLNKGGSVTQGNIGGVLWLTPDKNNVVSLKKGVDFHGTIIIEGDLILDGDGITITPVPGFPAIVATGRILVVKGKANNIINGLVVAGGGIAGEDGRAANSQTTINGGLIAGSEGYQSTLEGAHELNYDPDRCTLYDLDGAINWGEMSFRSISILDYN